MADTREILKKVRRLELRTRRSVETAFGGQYHSVFKGRGMNFEEVRQYADGDEVRFLDRNVTARTGELHVKRFVEERELTVMVMVDVSASGRYGSGETTKRELAAEVAAVLAFSAVRNNDKVGLILFSDRVELYVPPRKGRPHALRILREVLYHDAAGRGTDLAGALDYLNHIVRRRAVVFLVSDFQAADFSKPLGVTARRHDLIALPVRDPAEETLPMIGRAVFEDAETGEEIEIDTSAPAARKAYETAVRQRRERLEAALQKAQVDRIPLATGEDYLPALADFFRRREKRIAAH
ncbi:MAG: DUF58 domain-containing protein [Verrucomicrobia bacterium]|nr:DUF58 domain-containing protein [Verrucomicrobiota bacterium]